MKLGSTRRTLLQGVGVGVLVTLRFIMYLVSPYHEMLYVHPSPFYSIYLGAIADLAAIAVIWTLACRIKNTVLWALLWAGLIAFGIYDFSQLLNLPISGWAFVATAAASLVCLILLCLHDPWFRIADRLLRSCLVLIGFSGLWMIPEMGYIAVRSATRETTAFHRTPKLTNRATSQRIVWIVFDELSHDQVYEHRWPGLSLRNFDRLRLQSVAFTNVQPAGNYTDKVIPSLLLGKTVSEVKTSAGGDVAMYMKDVQEWQSFDPSQTIFADARRLGWSSGIVGWYNPYCRILADWVDSCWWSNQEPFWDNLSTNHTFWMNAVAPFLHWLTLLRPGIIPDRFSYWANFADSQARDYQAGLERAEALLRDPAVRFSYIHLDVPHPPGIYDRKKRTFSRGGSYVDNLALADEALGRLLDVAETNPNWSETTVIVCGDHSWRTPIWKTHAATWTREDEAASMGRFDPRPVLSIHFPSQETGSTFTSPFPALGLHGIIEDLLRGKIESESNLFNNL
jgi:hypothetical protein